MRRLYLGLLLTLIVSHRASAQGSALLEEAFDDVSALTGAGWVATNNSAPTGATGWFQGRNGIFPSQNGAPQSYVAANFENGNTISNWLLTPALALQAGDTITFYTRQNAGGVGDRLEVRLSANGASANVGTTSSSVGDFTTLLLSLNPSETSNGYPTNWTRFTFSLPPTALGRIGFRYFVSSTATAADYIGIDSVAISVPEPSTALGLLVGGAFAGRLRMRRKETSS